MVFDLGKAMAKKGEFESARLADFEFRQRARTFRLMAERLEIEGDPARIVTLITQMNDEALIEQLAERLSREQDELHALYQQCSVEARAQLIKERGDPTPHRLL